MPSYQTTEIDKLPVLFNSITKKIEESIDALLNSFDYESLSNLITLIKVEYSELKKKIVDLTVEFRINILEIDDAFLFEKYKKHCEIRSKAIYKIPSPEEIDSELNINNDRYLSHADLSKYSTFNVPEILDIYNLCGYLYTILLC